MPNHSPHLTPAWAWTGRGKTETSLCPPATLGFFGTPCHNLCAWMSGDQWRQKKSGGSLEEAAGLASLARIIPVWGMKSTPYLELHFKGRWQAPWRSCPLTCGTWKLPARLAATAGLEEEPCASMVSLLAKMVRAFCGGAWAEDLCKAPWQLLPALGAWGDRAIGTQPAVWKTPGCATGLSEILFPSLTDRFVMYTINYRLFHCSNCSHIISLLLSLFFMIHAVWLPSWHFQKRGFEALAFPPSPLPFLFAWFMGLREVFPIMIISSCFVDKRST